jgi:hypothetical protein
MQFHSPSVGQDDPGANEAPEVLVPVPRGADGPVDVAAAEAVGLAVGVAIVATGVVGRLAGSVATDTDVPAKIPPPSVVGDAAAGPIVCVYVGKNVGKNVGENVGENGGGNGGENVGVLPVDELLVDVLLVDVLLAVGELEEELLEALPPEEPSRFPIVLGSHWLGPDAQFVRRFAMSEE